MFHWTTYDRDNRVATAFFRGTATGGGTTIHNNQRLKVADCSHVWKDDAVKGGEEPFLDAAIVGWNLRDKKIAENPMTFLRPKNFGFTAGRHHFTPIYEQSKYKYLVYVRIWMIASNDYAEKDSHLICGLELHRLTDTALPVVTGS